MKKEDVLNYFDGVTSTAKALGTSKTTVSLWKEVIPLNWALLAQEVTAGALSLTRDDYPEKFGRNEPQKQGGSRG